MEPHSNHDQERQKYYTLLQVAEGDHPPPCSTMYYGQVQKRNLTQLTDTRDAGEGCQKKDKEYWVLKKVSGCSQMWYWRSCRRACRPAASLWQVAATVCHASP
jgi:hypothetical protein